jgi:hypothetical protein
MTDRPQIVTLVDLLDRLVDAPAPPPVSLAPQTPGWLVVGALVLAGLAALAWLWRARHRRAAFRREALAALSRVGDDPVAIAEILRRAALVAHGRAAVAGLSGTQWLEFLDQGMDGAPFSSGVGRAVAEAPYREGPAAVPGLAALARARLKHERLKHEGPR